MKKSGLTLRVKLSSQCPWNEAHATTPCEGSPHPRGRPEMLLLVQGPGAQLPSGTGTHSHSQPHGPLHLPAQPAGEGLCLVLTLFPWTLPQFPTGELWQTSCGKRHEAFLKGDIHRGGC